MTLKHYRTWEHPENAGWQYIDFSVNPIHFPAPAIWEVKVAADEEGFSSHAIGNLTAADLKQIQTVELKYMTSPFRLAQV